MGMVGYIMFLSSTDGQTRYGATFIIASGAYSFGALCNAQVAANVVSDTARSSAIATNVMFGNIGGLIATWSFLPFDGPNYHIGNGLPRAFMNDEEEAAYRAYIRAWYHLNHGD